MSIFAKIKNKNMNMIDWAKREIAIACKKENPDWDGKSFDYGCSCYQSALKAYESLCNDDHSGYSFSITKNILIRLMDGRPLTPITDEDFENVETCCWNDKLIQCPRMSSLFKKTDKDGNVSYSDNNRLECIDINSQDIYSSGETDKIVNKLYPITLPYYPMNKKFKIYSEDFLTDKNNGDYDTIGYLYMITPDDKRIELNIFRSEVNGKWVDITKEEYEERKKKSLIEEEK